MDLVKKCGNCFFGRYRGKEDDWFCINHNQTKDKDDVCSDWKLHK
jgi:hypothetical protein